MDKKTTGIIGWLWIIGWLIAYLAGDKEGAKFHLNQALVWNIINIAVSIVGGILSSFWVISVLVGIVEVALFVFWIIGLVHACKDEEIPLPIIGGIQILK